MRAGAVTRTVFPAAALTASGLSWEDHFGEEMFQKRFRRA